MNTQLGIAIEMQREVVERRLLFLWNLKEQRWQLLLNHPSPSGWRAYHGAWHALSTALHRYAHLKPRRLWVNSNHD